MRKPTKCKQILLSIGIGILNIAIAAVCGLALLAGVYKQPLDNIIDNVSGSAAVMGDEGTYPHVFLWCTSRLDNFTDSIMLLEASDETDDSAVNKALMVFHKRIDGKNPQESLVEHFINGKKYTKTVDYARYWHGYLLLLKPLLEIMDYGGIRIINGITQVLVFLVICILLWKKRIKHLIIPYFICYLMLMPVALAMSLQFSSCYYIASIGMILLLVIPGKSRTTYAWLVFLNIGILTAYFDFLTYPIATFGVPAALFLSLPLFSQENMKEKLKALVRIGIAWCAGYGGMWISKWLLTAVFTDYDIFGNAFASFLNRVSLTASDGVTHYSIFDCIVTNYQTFFHTPFRIMALIVTLYFIVFVYKRHDSSFVKIMAPYIVLAFAPIVWYCFATNHSMVHYWFTNKSCVVSVMSVMFGFAESFAFARRSSGK